LGEDRPLPTGVVTFLMTDVEGSTRMWEERPEVASVVVERHEVLISAGVGDHGGLLVKSKGEGDSTFSVFASSSDAARAAVETQLALQREPWPRGDEVRVRTALYTGDAELRGGDYYGAAPNRCSRLRAAAHGGQIVCSEATEASLTGLGAGISLRDLGLHRLRDVARAERVFQLDHDDLRVDFPPLRTLGVRNNLPTERTNFIGRDSDLAAVREHLATHHLVTLVGVGGSGKTRLAIKAASGELERFPDGVFFADLSPISDDGAVGGVAAAAVGLPRLALGTESGRPAKELVDFLSAREVLLVLDNCEHLIDACADLVDTILERCPDVTVLATSREPLELKGEQVRPVSPLPVPSDDPSELSEPSELSDSVRLFCDRAVSVRPDFVMTETNASDVAEICRRLDGIPLAIELAAAQVAQLSPHQIVDRLADRLHLLAAGRRADRHGSLQATIEWSYGLLTDEERVVFRRLAACPGSFSAEAALAVCAKPGGIAQLLSLVRKSLVVTDDAGIDRRYRMLETVRVFAEAALVESGEQADTRDRHRDFFLAYVEAIPPELTYLDPDGAVRREETNLRSALAWSDDQGRADLVGRLASTMNRVWIGDIRAGRHWLEKAMDGVDDLDPEHRVRVLAVAAHVAVLAIEAADGRLARKAVDAAGRRPGMWSSLAYGLLCLNSGIRFFGTKDPALASEVEHLGQTAVDLATEPLSRGLAWFWFGQARVLIDDLDGAADALDKGSVEAVPGGEMSTVSLALLAGLRHVKGEHTEALAAATEAVERVTVFPQTGLWAWALYSSLPYALELGHQGRHDEALDFMRELLDENQPRTPGVTTSVVVVLAALAVLRGDDETAGALLDYAGLAIIRSGIRTPVDMILYGHYLRRLGEAGGTRSQREREQAEAMSPSEAIALGLTATSG
jgi:predicted ATPase/class 3 adenylate cyclase